jgi:hypothetical protein|tara:strand:+ start:677 stop:880 length:204 start_codon:yes stop_codon:yes gene_type:complete
MNTVTKTSLSEFLGEKLGYAIAMTIFTAIFYWLTASHWILGKISYLRFIEALFIIYAIIIIFQVIRR